MNQKEITTLSNFEQELEILNKLDQSQLPMQEKIDWKKENAFKFLRKVFMRLQK